MPYSRGGPSGGLGYTWGRAWSTVGPVVGDTTDGEGKGLPAESKTLAKPDLKNT